jgi:cell division transport system permease protein
MRLHNVTYLLKEGGRNNFHNKLMSFACIGVLVACFLLIGSAVIISLTVTNVVRYVENQNEAVAFLEPNVTEDDISVIGLALGEMDNIGQITFASKAEVLASEVAQYGEEAYLLDGFEDSNPYPDQYTIQVKELGKLAETVAAIEDIQGVRKVNSQTDVATVLAGVRTTINYAGAGVVALLIIVSVVIITNTIKLTVFSRRKEINIMKYVGATDSFIRMPFLVEGMLIGLIAAVFAFLILGFSYTYLLQWAGENYGLYLAVILQSAVNFWDVAVYIFAIFAIVGICIGTAGSGVFVRRYLKV